MRKGKRIGQINIWSMLKKILNKLFPRKPETIKNGLIGEFKGYETAPSEMITFRKKAEGVRIPMRKITLKV